MRKHIDINGLVRNIFLPAKKTLNLSERRRWDDPKQARLPPTDIQPTNSRDPSDQTVRAYARKYTRRPVRVRREYHDSSAVTQYPRTTDTSSEIRETLKIYRPRQCKCRQDRIWSRNGKSRDTVRAAPRASSRLYARKIGSSGVGGVGTVSDKQVVVWIHHCAGLLGPPAVCRGCEDCPTRDMYIGERRRVQRCVTETWRGIKI
ncbi:hypothetical protein B0T14DRAFT_143748 [Immersiella caudata]|uniref:Uncharacterized protein n=1 Tax=Immersiella caudata TaxID=314043 RepID=A0AA40C6V9_9PEZI|nr:hypothetical protein B0T14DRAFT_143748 [Immersiella caudata]